MAKIAIMLLLVFMLAPAASTAGPSTQPAAVELKDLNGVAHLPLDPPAGKVSVLIFISTDCPISNSYAPEINRLCRDYQARNVSFFLIHSDPKLAEADARKHAKDYRFTCPVLIDRKHALVRHVGATVQSYTAVVGAGGRILYHGRIDNLYVAVGKRRYQATTHDLRDALDAILTGKPVAVFSTSAVGCSIGDDP